MNLAGRNGIPTERPHIYLGCPAHDNRCHMMFAMSLMRLTGGGQVSVTCNKVSGGGIHKARNNLAHDFLTKSKCQKLMFIDTDISFEPEMVYQLLARDLPIVGGPYTHKKTEVQWSARSIEGINANPATGLQEVAAIGTGFVMIDRRVFDTIREKFPQYSYIEDWNEGTGETKFDYFPENIIEDKEFGYPQRTFVTEDFGFCYLARKCGFKIYADTTFHVNHWEGSRCYPEKPLMQQPAPPKMPDAVNEADIGNWRKAKAA